MTYKIKAFSTSIFALIIVLFLWWHLFNFNYENIFVDKNNINWDKFPKTETVVEWDFIINEFKHNNVVSAGQNHNRNVFILTKDYRRLKSIEPNIDDVTKLVIHNDPKFKRINFVTE